jgi:hypothetical protein
MDEEYLDIREVDRALAAARLDEIAQARLLTLVAGECPKCGARLTETGMDENGVMSAEVPHVEPCVAGQSGLAEADQLVAKFRFRMTTVAAIVEKHGNRIMYVSWARADDGEQVR